MTIKEIAKLSGASVSTVSRVLNDPQYKCAKPGLRDKIWRIAIDQNYAPNEAARNLKRGKQRERIYCVNILMTRMDGSDEDPFFRELLQVVESELHGQGCILSKVWYNSIFSSDRKCQRADLDTLVRGMRKETEGSNDALIVIGRCNLKALEKLNHEYKNVVCLNRNPLNANVDEVTCDGRKIAAMAVDYLISLGHRNIAYAGACRGEARYRGYQDALSRNNIDMIPDYVTEIPQTEKEGYDAMERFLRMEECPTAIYCANDIMAIGMLNSLKKHRHLPFIPSVIASDDIEESQKDAYLLTTVQLPKYEMGHFAVWLLLDRLAGHHRGVARMELEGRLMMRLTCRRPENN